MPQMYDDLDRLPSRSTDKRYSFEMTDGSVLTVWADCLIDAEDILDRHGMTHYSLIGRDIHRLRWMGTSTAAGTLL